VAKKGAICPIFEGETPLLKNDPKIGANIGAITGILLLTSFPGLTSSVIRKHLPKYISTAMGHMHMIRKGIRSTNKPTVNEIMNEEIDPEPTLDPPRHINNRDHLCRSNNNCIRRTERHTSYRPTRPIPNHIWTRKFICHGDV
jgi:hypothetical protein